MKNTYIAIIVLVIVVAGGVFLFGNQNKLEAPATTNVDVNPFPTGTSSGSESVNPNAQNPNDVTPDAASGAPTPAPAPKQEAAVKEFTVSGQNFSFTPSSLTVKKGDTVKITFKNLNGNHNFIIDEFGVNSGLVSAGSQKTVEFTATKTGSFQYYCSVGSHRAMGMWGTLKVE